MSQHCFVVLAYKESPYIEKCISSCMNQSLECQIIIATTTDNEYIRSIAKKYSIPVVVGGHTNIGGDFDFALNTGRKTGAELVTIAHQDDIYDKNYAEEIIKAYKKNKNISIIFSDYYEIRKGKKVETNTNLKIKRLLLFPAFMKKNLKSKFAKRWILRFGNAICCPAVTFVSNNCPEKIFSSNFTCNVDWHAWEKLSKRKEGFVFVAKRLMGHRISEYSTTTDIIRQGIRTKEDFIIFRRFWPEKIAKYLTKFYQKSENSNNL